MTATQPKKSDNVNAIKNTSMFGRLFRPLCLEDKPQNIFIEATTSRPQLHSILVYGYIIARAKNLMPIFYANGECRKLLNKVLPNYFSEFKIYSPIKLPAFDFFKILVDSLFLWLSALLGRNVVRIKWCGMLIGDIVYDQYLAGTQNATLHRFDIRLLKFIFIVLKSVSEHHKMLVSSCASSVLLSHRVGLSGACCASASEQLGLNIYSFGGSDLGTLILATHRKSYEYTPTLEELDSLLDSNSQDLDRVYTKVTNELFAGNLNADAALAFSKKIYTERDDFAKSLNLDPNKKNIFIMLHAFTDYPHSHFNGMLFSDFHDWLINTLDCAKNVLDVNWIVKNHPSSRFYPTRDFDFKKFANERSAAHICFMDDDYDFDSRSICNIGDAIITCLGTAGFEFSALSKIPSITASDNPYAEAGFAVLPKSKEEYFKLLKGIRSIKMLNPEQHRRAKAAFVFIHRLSRVPVSAIPFLSHAEQRVYQEDDKYWDIVIEKLSKNEEGIQNELELYINEVEYDGFTALRTKPMVNLSGYDGHI